MKVIIVSCVESLEESYVHVDNDEGGFVMDKNHEIVNFKSEFAVKSMVKRLHQLIARANRLNLETKELEAVYRDLNVLELFADRHIVSVAGLQSAGKTLLIKRFLGLPEDLLSSEVGVGEKRPVLISSTEDITEITFRITRINKSRTDGFDLRHESITKEELNFGVQNPTEDTLWFEIILPSNPTLGHITLALLPGFERSSRSDSQKFLDLFLKCSTGMILVLNHSRLAHMDQETLLKKIASTYKDKSPGFVLTHASELSEDEQSLVEQRLMQKFGDIDANQIVLSDIDIVDVESRLEQLLRKNSGFTFDSRVLSTDKMSEISENLSMELNTLENSIEMHHAAASDRSGLQAILKEYRKQKVLYLSDLEKQLESTLDGHANVCIEKFKDELADENHSVMEKFKSAFKKNRTFKERRDLTKAIMKIYSEDSSGKLDYMILNSIEATADKRTRSWGPRGVREQSLPVPESKYIEHESMNDETRSIAKADDTLQGEITTSLQVVEQYLDSSTTDIYLEKRHIDVLPVVAGMMLQGMILGRRDDGSIRLDEEGIESYGTLRAKEGDLKGFRAEYDDLLLNTNMMIKGATVFLGVDAIDGTFDGFGAVTGMLQAIGLSSAAAAGGAILGIGGIFGSIAVLKGAEKIEKYKFERQDYAEKTLKATAKYQKEHILHVVEGMLDDMEHRLTIAYEERHNIHGNMGLYEEITSLIHQLQYDCGKLREEAFLDASFVD